MTNKVSILFLTFCVFFSCSSYNQNSRKITGIKLIYNIPAFKANTNEEIQLSDSILIYYKDKNILIREIYTSITYNNKAIQDGVLMISDEKTTISHNERKMRNYLFTENSNKGLKYDSISVTKFTLFNVDSLLRKKTFKGSKLYDISNDLLVEHKTDKKNGLVFEKYVPKIKYDESYNDTTYFVFDPKFKTINYSLSVEADSLKKMKLVEVKLMYNAKPKTVDNLIAIPKRVFLFEIKELKINNQKEILSLFERFKKDSEKLNFN